MRILFIIGPSIQVRRQDKYRESKFIPLEVYVEHIDEYYEILQVGLIFSKRGKHQMPIPSSSSKILLTAFKHF